jgi:hypothetical protein
LVALDWTAGPGDSSAHATRDPLQLAMNTKDKKAKMDYMNLHKSVGVLMAGAVLGRVGLRLASKVGTSSKAAERNTWQGTSRTRWFGSHGWSVH